MRPLLPYLVYERVSVQVGERSVLVNGRPANVIYGGGEEEFKAAWQTRQSKMLESDCYVDEVDLRENKT